MIQKLNLKKIIKNEKIVLCAVFIALGLVSFLISHEDEKPAPQTVAQVPDIDDLIPVGQTLLSIDLVNREALASILGATAVVDLLTVNPTSLTPQTKIASRVKMIRSPRNPNYFSLLVDADSATQITSHPGPYFAMVRNKKETNSDFYKDKKTTKVQISYQE
jgi:hypothetical protein